ncbi:MAG TPA: sigma factor-like helix-turn-helix DNA-binding protein [Candidatus Gracilibacteria bacterium]|nr:sigma factor-like helix-turn-helix DNA-binding protein [Candidatus Gracilibacteria bacterium]
MDTQQFAQSSGTGGSAAAGKINLTEIIEDMFMVLTPKEKEVIIKRFSLDNKPKQTLEKIGQAFSVTRERIRQIEKIALGKLRRTVDNTRLSQINKFAREILDKSGGVLLEEKLVAEILNRILSSQRVDANIIKLALNINPDLIKMEKTNIFKPFWRVQIIGLDVIRSIIDAGIALLNKRNDVITDEAVGSEISSALSEKGQKIEESLITSALEVDKRIKRVKEGFGLMSWRHINPRSIRDKAYIVLKKTTAPLHFVDIANKIAESGFDKKVVTTQAVHNELIRYDQFVLVGRGLYALKEWGYKKGTVADVIEDLLGKKSPMTKQEIIQGVLKQRQVKKGTISLNLQKNPKFVRVGRAVYKLDSSK